MFLATKPLSGVEAKPGFQTKLGFEANKFGISTMNLDQQSEKYGKAEAPAVPPKENEVFS